MMTSTRTIITGVVAAALMSLSLGASAQAVTYTLLPTPPNLPSGNDPNVGQVTTVPFGSASPSGGATGTASIENGVVTVNVEWSETVNANALVDYEGTWTTSIGPAVDITKVTEVCVQTGASRVCGRDKAWTNRNGLEDDWISGFDQSGAADDRYLNTVELVGERLLITRRTQFIDDPASFFFGLTCPGGCNSTVWRFGLDPGQGSGPPVANPFTLAVSTQGRAPGDSGTPVNAGGIPGNNLGTPPSVVTAFNASRGTVSVSGANITYTPDAGFFSGTATFDYTITNSQDEEDSNTITVQIADLTPVVTATTNTGNNVTTINGTFTAGNGALDQHAVSVTANPAAGTCAAQFNGTGTRITAVLTVTDANFSGAAVCTIRLTDGDGSFGEGAYTFNLQGAGGGGGGGGGPGLQLPGGKGSMDLWSLALLGALPLLRRRRLR